MKPRGRPPYGVHCGVCNNYIGRWVFGEWQHAQKIYALLGPDIRFKDSSELTKFCEICAPKVQAGVIAAVGEVIKRLQAEAHMNRH